MTYKGHIENGLVVLDEPALLPDGTEVDVTPRGPTSGDEKTAGKEKSWAEQLAPFIGCVKGLPSDLADNLDHYLYGVPKKKLTLSSRTRGTMWRCSVTTTRAMIEHCGGAARTAARSF